MIVYFHSAFINSPSLVPINISHRVVSISKLEARNVGVVFDFLCLAILIYSIRRSSSLAGTETPEELGNIWISLKRSD